MAEARELASQAESAGVRILSDICCATTRGLSAAGSGGLSPMDVRCHAMREDSGRMRQMCDSLEFESGVQAPVVAGDRSPVKERRLVVHGTNAIAVIDDTLDWEEKLVLHGADGEVPGQPVPLQAAEPLALERAAFLRCAALGEDCPTDGPEALRVMEALDACRKSAAAQSGR